MTTLAVLLQEVPRLLQAGGIPPSEALGEARLLVMHALQLPRERLILESGRALSEEETQRVRDLAQRRAAREPLAYLVGERAFFGLLFHVAPGVLIPRPETEFVVEEALRAHRQGEARIVDVGTGSGCIAVAVAVHAPQAEVYATDLSGDALNIARGNAERHGVADRVHFAEGDLLQPVAGFAPFDVIASNPPYIAPADVEELQPEVRDWEPRIALGTHPDALHFYRRLALEAPPLLAPGGSLIVEVGQGQADDVIALWQDAGLQNARAIPDYAGIARVVVGSKAD